MWFWFFMTVSNLILPVLMIVLGKVFMKKPPKQINGFYGYRTRRSMKIRLRGIFPIYIVENCGGRWDGSCCLCQQW